MTDLQAWVAPTYDGLANLLESADRSWDTPSLCEKWALPARELLDQLRSPALHGWTPPSGGAAGALSHAVIHSLDVTVALDEPAVAPAAATTAVLDHLTAAAGAVFGVDLSAVKLEATDRDWSWGSGDPVRPDIGSLVALVSGRTLPDGRALPRSADQHGSHLAAPSR